jgi:hypothetical protein
MSHNIDLPCGCLVYVSVHPESGVAHTRILERRGRSCGVRRHEVGLRLILSELPPAPARLPEGHVTSNALTLRP